MGLIGFSTLEYSFPPPGSPELDFSECVGVYSLLLDPLFLERFADFLQTQCDHYHADKNTTEMNDRFH